MVRIDTPEDARISAYREWLLVRPRSPWTVGDTTYPAGSLLAAKYDDFLTGSCELTVLFEPDEHTSLEQYSWTRNHLLMVTLSDVQSPSTSSPPARTAGRQHRWRASRS